MSCSSGRGCQVRGENFLEWNTFRLNNSLKNSDVIGCGWVRAEDSTKGTVYFTLNGERVPNEFHDTPPEMLPFVHIQKKVSVITYGIAAERYMYCYTDTLSHTHRL